MSFFICQSVGLAIHCEWEVEDKISFFGQLKLNMYSCDSGRYLIHHVILLSFEHSQISREKLIRILKAGNLSYVPLRSQLLHKVPLLKIN